MMNKRNTEHVPEDLVVEILSRVPTKSLARFRSTSKAWNALIKDGRFSKKYSANAPRPRQSLVIMLVDFRVYLVSLDLCEIEDNKVALTRQFNLEDPRSEFSKEVDICNLFHCDGLLLCTTKDKRLVVWNPVSGETKWIQQPKKSYKESDLFALGYDTKSSCYKIIRMDQFARRGAVDQTEHEIYDFTSNSWSVVGVCTNWFYIPRDWSRGVSLKGNTYWLAYDRWGTSVSLIIFDFSIERFQAHSLPHSLRYSGWALSVVREDRLCVLDVYSLDVWMSCKIESTGVMSWSKILTAKANYKFCLWMSFVADEQHKVLVGYNNNILHIVAEDRYMQVNDIGHGDKSYGAFVQIYVPTLVQIQQGI
ncbi:unnamed protein product [Microthlaspi erraticum]|uniref:F-box domain-containing protein n=1 Tax=Microthlaspi erraticum TaxID=1685480 RepID=A0A6D2K8C3_9BRAS|nr:unnamed protein product [Microthlaspi erraticum]